VNVELAYRRTSGVKGGKVPYREKVLACQTVLLENLCSQLSLPLQVKEDAVEILKTSLRSRFYGTLAKYQGGFICAIVSIASRNNGIHVPLTAFDKWMGQPEGTTASELRMRRLARYPPRSPGRRNPFFAAFCSLVKNVGIKVLSERVVSLLPSVIKRTRLNGDVGKRALEIASQIEGGRYVSGCSPRSLAAGCLLVASEEAGVKVSIKAISLACGVREVTVRGGVRRVKLAIQNVGPPSFLLSER
jgi:transcription initiation factor TFIIIB Brf1 subunit/transcription initiation factor TFIIB